MTHQFREAWLAASVEALAPLFAAREIELPAVRVSVGFPGGRGPKTSVIGQCWNSHAASDSVAQIFIHPSLIHPLDVLATMIHELIHAVDDCQHGHKGPFVKMARAMGLAGKPTATHASEELLEELAPIVEALGPYPHAALAAMTGGVEGPKKQSTRMLKVQCPEDGYIVRTTAKWLEVGVPSCPCGAEMVVPA